MIKYSWARYKGKMVHIDDVTIQMRQEGTFYNLISNKKMTAYLHGKFQRHFHHLGKVKYSNETYLHEVAKEIFKESYLDSLNNNIPFYLDYHVKGKCNRFFSETNILCDMGLTSQSYDLTQTFDKILVEKGYNEFRPDIQLLSSDKPSEVIFLEFAVTHESTQKKINSGKKIIEISIKKDSDIQKLKRKRLSINDRNTKLFNFKLKTVRKDYCYSSERGCRNFKKIFVLYKNGTYDFKEYYLESIISDVYANEENIKFIDYQYEDHCYKSLSASENEDKYLTLKKIPIRKCELCRYVAHNRKLINKKKMEYSLFCKFKKEETESNYATGCKYFRVVKPQLK